MWVVTYRARTKVSVSIAVHWHGEISPCQRSPPGTLTDPTSDQFNNNKEIATSRSLSSRDIPVRPRKWSNYTPDLPSCKLLNENFNAGQPNVSPHRHWILASDDLWLRCGARCLEQFGSELVLKSRHALSHVTSFPSAIVQGDSAGHSPVYQDLNDNRMQARDKRHNWLVLSRSGPAGPNICPHPNGVIQEQLPSPPSQN
jgi:hypothetical protein